MAELGDTTDPRALVPGDPETVRGEIALCNRYAAGLGRAGEALRTLDTADWRGQAADAFHDAFDGHPIDWLKASDAFRDTADSLTGYVEVLEWAQRQATEAIALWEEAETATRQARAEHGTAVAREQKRSADAGTPATPIPFTDPGGEKRAAAQDLLHRTRIQLAETGDRTRTTVLDLTAAAPARPGFWGQAGNLASDFASGLGDWGSDLGDILGNLDNIPATLSAAATNPTAFAKQLVSWDQFHTNPARWAGHVLPDAALTLVGGAGAVKKGGTLLKGVTTTGRANRVLDKAKHNGKGITDHVANRGADIGEPGKGRKMPTRNVPDADAVQQVFDDLSHGGKEVPNTGYGGGAGKLVEMPDGSKVGIRQDSKTSPDPTVELIAPDGQRVKIHTERWK